MFTMEYTQLKKDKNIIVIVYFFGKFPWYFNYFLHSCSYNPDIDFLIVTDNDCTDLLPGNVRFLKKSLREIKELSDEKLGFNTTLDPPPKKFCDFRPAFGVIFQEYIKGYSFWGHGDLDVIFGNIRDFITDELLNDYDIISLRHDYISSWFTLYRNCTKINQLFMMGKDYMKVFTTPRYFNFDETNSKFLEFFDGIPYNAIHSEVESMTHLIKKLHDKNYIKAYFDLHALEGLPGKLKWEKGKLYYRNRYEVLLYHLIIFKKVYNPKRIRNIPNVFHISRTRIYT